MWVVVLQGETCFAVSVPVAAETHLNVSCFEENAMTERSTGTSCGRVATSVRSPMDIRVARLSSGRRKHTKVSLKTSRHLTSGGGRDADPGSVAALVLTAEPQRRPAAARRRHPELPAQPDRPKFTPSLFFRLGGRLTNDVSGDHLKHPSSHR